MFQRNPDEFLHRFITVNETWIHYFTPEMKEQSKQWISLDESDLKKVKTVKSAGKVIVTHFWDACGIIHIDYLPSKQTINGDYYAVLLDRFNILKKKHPHLAKKKCSFIKTMHGFTRARHRWPNSMNFATNCFSIQHSPDLTPCDCLQT